MVQMLIPACALCRHTLVTLAHTHTPTQLSFQPGPGDASIYRDPQVFALAWLSLWTPITCLEHFAEDIRGRILLDLLNEPSRLGSGGVGWR